MAEEAPRRSYEARIQREDVAHESFGHAAGSARATKLWRGSDVPPANLGHAKGQVALRGEATRLAMRDRDSWRTRVGSGLCHDFGDAPASCEVTWPLLINANFSRNAPKSSKIHNFLIRTPFLRFFI